eukprot:TRINITY_DN12511_c0_g1::TRINITY_DN12511_c0_g1_i1::g.15116::m.15116 TRINITY_DN12511_c0_g1::TRINITY_DN12511_c0_g1_i1::g.15116  ORF type:complete len:337 (+),score=62.24,sp/Q75QI0/CFDP1_CHICK/33.81/1e-09,BCNT/PF07572.7/1.1e+04,BCNT/PF07572.7/1.2e+04,BCNT/PF07572.7/2e-18,DUF966/PF06136.8/2.8 TRINITY_DN12511_c0_g1_i1:56-1066(+)
MAISAFDRAFPESDSEDEDFNPNAVLSDSDEERGKKKKQKLSRKSRRGIASIQQADSDSEDDPLSEIIETRRAAKTDALWAELNGSDTAKKSTTLDASATSVSVSEQDSAPSEDKDAIDSVPASSPTPSEIPSTPSSLPSPTPASNKSKIDDLWAQLKSGSVQPKRPASSSSPSSLMWGKITPQKPKPSGATPSSGTSTAQDSAAKTKAEEAALAAKAALEALKGKSADVIEIKEKCDFAGQDVVITHKVKVGSEEEKKLRSSSSNLDSLVDAISKKRRLTTTEKSRHDWNSFTQKEELQDELTQNRKGGYLDKVAFLARTDVREHEADLASRKSR